MGDVARSFGATTDQVVTGVGAISRPLTAVTFGLVIRPGTWSGLHDIIAIPSSGGYYTLVTFNQKLLFYRNGDGTNPASTSSLTANKWWALFVTKAAGTATARFHLKNLTDGAAWVHENASASMSDSDSMGTAINFGKGPLEGSGALFDLAGAAAWDSALSDAAVEALISSNKAATSAWLAASPAALWVFDQASTSTAVTDQTGGGATESAHTGTSVLSAAGAVPWDGSSGPASFNRTASESLGLSDAAARAALARARTAADTLGLADAAVGARGTTRTATETLPLSDAAARGPLTLPRDAADTLALADTATIPTAPPAPKPILVRERPPLRLAYDLKTPSGRHYRWAADEPDPANVPSGGTGSNTMPGGFERESVTLPRKATVDYNDLEELSILTVYGPGGEVAGQGRLETSPRTSGDQMSIQPGAVGLQARMGDRKDARMIYRDVDLSHWRPMGLTRRIALIGSQSAGVSDGAVQPDPTSNLPALATEITGPWSAASRGWSEAWYDGQGIPIGALYHSWRRGANVVAAPNWLWQAGLADLDVPTETDVTGNLLAAGPGSGTLEATDDKKRLAWVQLFWNALTAAGNDNMLYGIYWQLAVYGQHVLPLQGTEPDAGFLASDVIAHALATFAPGIKFSTGPDGTITPSQFVIPHLVFLDLATAADIVRQSDRFELRDWAVWEDGWFFYNDRGARGRKWRARVAPSGLSEAGPQIDRLWNSVIVQYTDAAGTTKTVGPPGSGANTEDAALVDLDPENPANKAGETRRDALQMGVSTPAGAIQVGARFLAEQKVLSTAGQARLVGHVEDEHGILRPYWEVRAGDEISFVDAANTAYRRIVRVERDDAAKACTVDLDSPPDGLAATLERLAVALVPFGAGS